MGFVKPNKTNTSKPNDVVMTKKETAKWIINYFNPSGTILEACKGDGSFYDEFNGDKDWCEITQGRDFFDYDRKVEWIITNPPYSIFDKFLIKAFEIADNIVFFCPLNKVFKGKKLDIKIKEYGDIKEIVHMGGGNKHGFPFGFSIGCIHYKRNYTGDIKYVRAYDYF
tara:strand:+ start:1824 stop:2327 length:504 start_codon:yes stop_codon:yes gene_type:complete